MGSDSNCKPLRPSLWSRASAWLQENGAFVFFVMALVTLIGVAQRHRAGASGRLLTADKLRTFGEPLLALVESSDEVRQRELGVALGRMRERATAQVGGAELMWSAVDGFLRQEEQIGIDLRANLTSAEAVSADLRGEVTSLERRLARTERQLRDASQHAVQLEGSGSAADRLARAPIGEANTCSSLGWREVERQHAIAHRAHGGAAAAAASSMERAAAAAALLAERALLVSAVLDAHACAFWLLGHSLHAFVAASRAGPPAPASDALYVGVHRADWSAEVIAALAEQGLAVAGLSAATRVPCAFRDASHRIALRVAAFDAGRDFASHEPCEVAAKDGATESAVAAAAMASTLSTAYPPLALAPARFAGVAVNVPRDARAFLLAGRGASLGFGARRGATPGRTLGARAVRRCRGAAATAPLRAEALPAEAPPVPSRRRRRLLGSTAAAECREWKLKYTVVPGTSWGSLPVALQSSWKLNDCDYVLGSASFPRGAAGAATRRAKKRKTGKVNSILLSFVCFSLLLIYSFVCFYSSPSFTCRRRRGRRSARRRRA